MRGHGSMLADGCLCGRRLEPSQEWEFLLHYISIEKINSYKIRSNVLCSYLDMVSSLKRLNRPCIRLNHSLFLVFLGFKLQTSCYSG